MHRTPNRLLVLSLLAQLGFVTTQRAAAQAAPANAEVPPPAPPAPALVEPTPAVDANGNPLPPEPPPLPPMPPSEPLAAEPPIPDDRPTQPPALGPVVVPQEPLEPASTASPRVEQFRSSDGDVTQSGKPIFEVGDFHVQASGYVQAQYQSFQQSKNQLSPDGSTLLNLSGFAVQRARALVEGSNKWSSLVLEYDVANLNSALTGVQRAEATLLWRNPNSNVPYLAGTLGVFRTPFGYEAPRSARDRLFAENATVTQAFFPGQSDTGARLEGGIEFFRYAIAFVNGQPINEPRFGGRTPTKQGDFLGRLGIDTTLGRVRLVGGASYLKGKGFTAGTPTTKDGISVRDVTEQGALTPTSVTLVPGRASTASRTFDRWGTGVDFELSAQVLAMWKLWARAEFMFGSNLDRGIFISNPLAFNTRGYGTVVSLESLIFQSGLVGVRYDFYNPNPDLTGNVAGSVVKTSQRIDTTSALVGFQLPNTRTRLFAQYDRVKDHLALDTNGRPADMKNDRFTVRLQVSLW